VGTIEKAFGSIKKINSGVPNRIFERYSEETIIKLAVIIKG